MAPWAVCCRTLEQHQEMHFPQSGVMHFSFAEDLHLCILLPSGEPPSPPSPCTTREGGRETLVYQGLFYFGVIARVFLKIKGFKYRQRLNVRKIFVTPKIVVKSIHLYTKILVIGTVFLKSRFFCNIFVLCTFCRLSAIAMTESVFS